MKSSLHQVGDTYKNFELIQQFDIKEIKCLLKVVRHNPSGAQVVHLENEDDENVFCLAFRTLPENSNGVAHILEHTVLCGSEKFPVKDPFFSMSRRSLNTYMNAHTTPDYTCYPAASQVENDFYNLLEVYVDAVFKPELKELSFLQEGHRLEFADLKDPSSPLEYKGIVFNEMKGAMSSPIARLWQQIMTSLFPDVLYRHNYGGDPVDIPSLTYQGLLDFHKAYYDPARCTFCFYGNIPLEKHLDFIEKNALKNVKSKEPLDYNPMQKKFAKPVEHVMHYPISQGEEPEGKTFCALSWLTCPLNQQKELLVLQVLDNVLMGTDASPLKYALLKSKKCQNVFSYMEDELSQVPYSIIFEGCNEKEAQDLKRITYETLEKLASEPIDSELVEAAIHQLEFSRLEISSDYCPYGLNLLLKLIPLKNVGAPLQDALKIHTLFDSLRDDLKDPLFLSKAIKRHFLDNTHQSFIEMRPDSTLSKKERDAELSALAAIKSKLTEGQSKLIVEKALELEAFQNEQEHQSLEVLPKVTLKDVSNKPKEVDLGEKDFDAFKCFYHKGFTNQVVYLDVAQKLPKVSSEELPFVRLFSHLLTQMGTEKRSYEDNLKKMQETTGGVYATLDIFNPIKSSDAFYPQLVLLGKALARNQDELLNLTYDFLTSPKFNDPKRLKELLGQHFNELDQSLKNNPLKYATNLSYSVSSKQSYLNHHWYGLGYYKTLRGLAQNFDEHQSHLVDLLQSLKSRLLHGCDPHVICCSNEELVEGLIEKQLGPLSTLPEKDFTPFEASYKPHTLPPLGIVVPSPVFFTALSFPTLGFEDEDTPLMSIAAKLFDNTCLHQAIREQGGAYGGGSSNRMGQSKFSFYAYRDPNLSRTMQAFHRAVEQVAKGQFSDRELEEAKLGIIQKLDHPISPEHMAYTGYVWHLEGKTFEFRQAIRNTILKASREDIQKVVSEKIQSKISSAQLVTFSSKANLEKEYNPLKDLGFGSIEIQSL